MTSIIGRATVLLWALAQADPAWPQASPNAQLDSAQVAAWREDLRVMAAELDRRHPNLYHTLPKAQFDSAVSALYHRVPSLARHQVVVEMARIVARVGDGHTNIAPTRDPQIKFRTLPVELYWFKDGLFVRSAHQSQRELAGSRVVRIGRLTPEAAYAMVRELIGRDNEMGARFFAPFLMAMPEVLHALGIIDDMEEAGFTLERDGRHSTVKLRPLGPAAMMPSDTDVSWWPEPGWVDMRNSGPAPLWLRENPRTQFWLEYQPHRRLVYLQYNKVGDKEDESIAQFSSRLLSLLDTAAVDRLVLDLRLNRGGDGTLNPPLIVSLIKARKLDQPGRFFVLIGRSTFSAAQFLVNELEHYTSAVFVGEPTGGKVNSYSDSRKIILPNSGITVRVSTLWWQEDPRDDRQWKAPDIAAELTSTDYRNNSDPALQAALAYRPGPSVMEQMRAALSTSGVEEAVRRYRAYLSDPRHAYADLEDDLNDFGYQLLKDRRFAEAIAILELNAVEHPESANVHDSLGEAYMLAGKREQAIRSYQRSLQLDPANENARQMLAELKS